MDRRGFLISSLALANKFAFADEPEKKKPMSANEFLLNFPKAEAIPEVAHIEHIIHDSAVKALVIFRQRHCYWPKMDFEEVRGAEQSQLELFRSLRWHVEQKTPGFDHIMCEEYIDPNSSFIEDRRQRFRKEIAELIGAHKPQRVGLVPRLGQNIEEAMQNESILRKRKDGMSMLAFYGAGQVMAFTKGITPLPGADIVVEKKTDEALQTPDPNDDDRWVFTERENMLLKLAADSDRLVSYAIFGANHRWTDNMEAWNKQHPKKKLSSIVVSTHAVRGFKEP